MDVALLISCAQECSRKTLRKKLRNAVSRILVLSQIKPSDTRVRLDEAFLLDAVGNIDWKELCCEFDSIFATQDASPNSLPGLSGSTRCSTLDILLECFEDPSIWPDACAPALFVILWEVLCSSGRRFSLGTNPVNLQLVHNEQPPHAVKSTQQWSPSQVRILNHMTNKILLQNPAILSISFWTQRISALFLDERYTSHHYEIIVRMLRHWSVEIPCSQMLWLTLLAYIMVALDKKEVSLIKEQKLLQQSASHFINESANDSRCLKRKRIATSSLKCLHGDFFDQHANPNDFSRSVRCLSQPTNIHYHDTMWKHNTTTSASVQPLLCFWKIEAKCIETAILFSHRMKNGCTFQHSIRRSSAILTIQLQHLLEVMRKYPKSFSVRLCTVVLAYLYYEKEQKAQSQKPWSTDSNRYDVLLPLVWLRVAKSISIEDLTVYITFYTELITTCSTYNDGKFLLTSISPFLKNLIDLLKISEKTHPEKTHPEILRIHLRCFASFLLKRGTIILSTAMHAHTLRYLHSMYQASCLLLSLFQMISQAKNDFCQYFYDCYCNEINKKVFILKFQKANNFYSWNLLFTSNSYVRTCARFSNKNNELSLKEKAISLKPFVNGTLSCCIMKPFSCNKLMYTLTSVSSNSPNQLLELTSFDDSILVFIFSFFTFKRLLHVQSICKRFMKVADNNFLWYSLYTKKFRCLERYEEFNINKCSDDWKLFFKNRVIAERDLQRNYKFYNKDWKTRVCDRKNCYVLLLSAKAMKSHVKKFHS